VPDYDLGNMRLLWTSVALAILLCIPFAIWGGDFMRWFTGDAAVSWIRSWGAWGWFAVIALLMSDLLLPIPATPVMSAAGFVYGTALGGFLSAIGSFAAGMTGYGLCRCFGRGIAIKLAGERELADHETLFRRTGPWLVAASRWLPLFPEVVSCLAGLTRMPLPVFAASLACGALPMGFVYAGIGAAGQENPRLALALSIAVPPLLWLFARPWIVREKSSSS
jgi:uncharacterized membrane protein YdjX (TVP38/TMEM64 family)